MTNVMLYKDGTVISDGFACGYGRFYALVPNRVERVQGSHLRQMFLPKLTPEANKRLRDSYGDSFVRGQLKHYGVHFEEGEISGNGTLLIKKVLQAGKCDRVPDHITQLQERMHAEWLDKLTPEKLSSYPDWIMEKFFLSRGQADPTKTTTVVGIPLPPRSTYRAGQIREAAEKIPGLYQVTGSGPKTQTIFMGWDRAAVTKTASGHAATEAKKIREADDKREAERAEMHTDYLDALRKKKAASHPHSPIGSYMVDCQEIEREWPDLADDLTLDIYPTEDPNVFKAEFNFGVLEGVMILSTNENALIKYCSGADREDDSEDEDDDDDDDDDDDEVEYDEKPTKGGKRKANVVPKGRGRPPKKAKAVSAQSLTYMLRSRCRETGEGMIHYQDEEGTITFKDKTLVSFTADAALPCVGRNVKFVGRKVSDVTANSMSSWNDYSERAYERERVGRWR